MNATLLVELLVEELPPKALRRLGDVFAATLGDSLKAQGLATAAAQVTAYATPRRLAVKVEDVAARAADRVQPTKLMPVSVGLDAQGQPAPALLKRLAVLGVAADDALPRLRREGEGKAETLWLDVSVAGVELAAGAQVALDAALAALPIPKLMSYQLVDGWSTVKFVRPAHGLVALHGDAVLPLKALGLQAGRQTKGHRFEARVAQIDLNDADSYDKRLLDDGAVIAGFDARRAEIERQLMLGAQAAGVGLAPAHDDALLDEVTALVELPQVLMGSFEPEFLAVPPECLILTMKVNQKYFPLLDANGRLTHQFLLVSNIRPTDASEVIAGNERVVRPRLADAKFFFDQDRKKSLVSRVPALDKVVYHGKLGSQGERTQRVRTLALTIGECLGGVVLAAQAERAALLAKADLLTDMVGEFPELQGVMGGYYARHDGETEAIAFAIEDHYRPRFAGDALPRNAAGVALALADKLETLAGLFGIGQLPTGDKDPFALRRHALGVIRLLIERELALAVPELVDMAFAAFPAGHGDAREALSHFVYERLIGYLRDLGYSAQEVDAVIALRPPRWAEIVPRLVAVRAFAELPDAQALAAANKRIANILRKREAGATVALDAVLLTEGAEQALHAALLSAGPRALAAFDSGDLQGSLRELATLRAPVDAFFEQVMVNAEDPALRANRLSLLAQLHAAMNRVADLSRLSA